MSDIDQFLARCRRLGGSSILIQHGGTAYIDPVDVPAGSPRADVVFLTHTCGGHCSEKDVEAISTPSTVVAGPRDCVSKFRLNQMPLHPGEPREILGMRVEPVAAYNPREGTYHPKGNDWMGFFIQFPGSLSIYYPGATSFVPEMRDVHPDVLFFPVAAHDGFREDEVVPFLETIKPKVVVPVNYSLEQDRKALDRLAQACRRLEIGFKDREAVG